MGHLEAVARQPVQDLQAHARPGLRAGPTPVPHRHTRRGDELVAIGRRIGDPELGSIRRRFGNVDEPVGRLIEDECLAEAGGEGGFTRGGSLLTVRLGVLWVRAPVLPGVDGLQRRAQRLPMPFVHVRHRTDPSLVSSLHERTSPADRLYLVESGPQ